LVLTANPITLYRAVTFKAWIFHPSDTMEQKQIAIVAIVAIAIVAIAGAAVFLMGGNSNSDKRTPAEICNESLDAIKETNILVTEEFVLIDDEETTATLCTGEAIGSRVRWVTIWTVDAEKHFSTDKADETFNKYITEDTATIMSKTVTMNHITEKSGLKDVAGYWYYYPDSYIMMEFIGYNSAGHYVHAKIKIGDTAGTSTAADIDKIVSAVSKVL